MDVMFTKNFKHYSTKVRILVREIHEEDLDLGPRKVLMIQEVEEEDIKIKEEKGEIIRSHR